MFTFAPTANTQVHAASAAATACASDRSVSVRMVADRAIDMTISISRDTNASGVLRSE